MPALVGAASQCVITYDALRGLAQVLRENQFRVQRRVPMVRAANRCTVLTRLLPPNDPAHAVRRGH